MPERSVVTWNAMICGSASHANVEDALSLFLSTNKEGIIVPNSVTFVGLIDVAREDFYSMKESTWVDLMVLVWDLGVCSSSKSQIRLSPVSILDGLI
ncbi:PPR domain protein [Medicago truncatula]|uniref:PPR domain protein n=1 Tax=Medicago truncatula TaxID=3880 RepID=A0A072U0Y4_MEDTR|nr:PPR domain protein [Medicago truncatula]